MRTTLLAALVFIVNICLAQRPGYDDLKVLFADGNYEKLIKSAEAYTQKESSKNDALPYYFLGQGYYKISLTNNKNPIYQNAYKDAISAFGNCIKRDVNGEVQRVFVVEIEEFKMSLVNKIAQNLASANYTEASTWVTKFYKLNQKSIGTNYLDGVCKYRAANKAGAELVWKLADQGMSALTDINTLGKAEADLLKIGIMQSADCFVADKQVERAKTLMKKGKPFFEFEADFMAKYKQIVK